MAFAPAGEGIPLYPVSASGYEKWLAEAPARQRNWVDSSAFTAQPGEVCSLPDEAGGLQGYLFGMQASGWLYQLSDLPARLPAGDYVVAADWDHEQRLRSALGWGLGCYQFDTYKKAGKAMPSLCLEAAIGEQAGALLAAHELVRDLVNTPTEDMGPAQLGDAMQAQADRFGARVSVIRGDDLLTENYPAIHAVGRASTREPRLLHLEWGSDDDPLLVLCGKGVCFDTGGLNLKTGTGMSLMKKDMGGAAHVLALASLVMQARLPVRLSILVPAVENSVSGNAYRPGDVIPTRKGLSVEVGNTDAEGRLVLADALASACERRPDLVIDFATLTGAARVALGTDMPPVFSNDIEIARRLVAAGECEEDPLWAMPLYAPYRELLKSNIADLSNIGSSPYGGCITAALFLEHFVEPDIDWVHIDTWAWNQTARPGRPVGGDAQGLRAAYRYLCERYRG